MPDGTGGHSPAEDDIDRALRELTQGKAGEAKFHEPTAAERAKAAKKQADLARKQAGGQRRGARKGGRRAHEHADGWRGGVRHDTPVRRRRGKGKQVVAVVAALVLAGAAVYGWREFGSRLLSRTASGTPGVTPSTPANLPVGPGADPFLNSPGDHWADGAAGIVSPVAEPVGPFSAAQVAAAYAATRNLLIAADLDQATLLGRTPTAYENLLTAQQRQDFVTGLDKMGTATNGGDASTRAWVVSFAPGTTTLIGGVIKVHGTMSTKSTTVSGVPELDIDVDYYFVYPVEPPHAPQDWMRVVAGVKGYVEFDNAQDPGGPLQPWDMTVASVAGERCDVHDGFIHPSFPNAAQDTTPPSGPAVNPYAMNDAPPSKVCRLTTGT